jgi:signal transduction histidine kinase
LRYDDRLSTIMNARTRDAGARAAMWVQLVDVLAQDKGRFPPDLRSSAYKWLEKWRLDVPERRRMLAAAALSSRAVPVDLVDFFARDGAPVAGALLGQGGAVDSAWVDYLPEWPATTRAILAHRNDLPAELTRALDSLGPHILALPSATTQPVVEAAVTAEPLAPIIAFDPDDILDLPLDAAIPSEVVVPETAQTVDASIPSAGQPVEPSPAEPSPVAPISDLLHRIERFRRDNPGQGRLARHADQICNAFVFEADRHGAIHWVDGAPRGALIGLSLADMALPGESGVDGQAAGAFRKRTRIDHARLLVPGQGPAAGHWLISGDPVFEPDSGRFLGYLGQARRFVQAEASPHEAAELIGGGMRPASVRQLVHELRTPLNAIRGFAEMIEGQFLGPVDDVYRARASNIMADSAKLLRVFEDLDAAARLETNDFPIAAGARADVGALVRLCLASQAMQLADRDVTLRLDHGDQHVMAGTDEATLRQLLSGFVELLSGVTSTGEQVAITLTQQDGRVTVSALREASLESRRPWDWTATVQDADRGRSDILPLGLGYQFRLLSRLARRVSGELRASGDGLSLILPMAASSGEQSNRV